MMHEGIKSKKQVVNSVLTIPGIIRAFGSLTHILKARPGFSIKNTKLMIKILLLWVYLLLDFVLTDPRNFTNCVKAAHYIAWAMLERARFKKNKYQLLCHQAGYKFLPFSCEIFGSMTEDSLDLIRLLVRKAADRSHIPYSILLPYWIKRISMNIQKGNASFFMKSTVRMTGSDSLHDASVSMSTHHIRIAAE